MEFLAAKLFGMNLIWGDVAHRDFANLRVPCTLGVGQTTVHVLEFASGHLHVPIKVPWLELRPHVVIRPQAARPEGESDSTARRPAPLPPDPK
jgi:hypothetical protein